MYVYHLFSVVDGNLEQCRLSNCKKPIRVENFQDFLKFGFNKS